MTEINDREKMSRTLNKNITVLDNADKTLLVLSGAGGDVFLFLFTTVTGTYVAIAGAIIRLVSKCI